MIQFIVFPIGDGIELRRGFCSEEDLVLQAGEEEEALKVSRDVLDSAHTLQRLGGEILPC